MKLSKTNTLQLSKLLNFLQAVCKHFEKKKKKKKNILTEFAFRNA